MSEPRDEMQQHPATEPVGRVNLPVEEAAEPLSALSMEQPRVLVRVALGALMLGLMLLALFVMLSGAFEVVPN